MDVRLTRAETKTATCRVTMEKTWPQAVGQLQPYPRRTRGV